MSNISVVMNRSCPCGGWLVVCSDDGTAFNFLPGGQECSLNDSRARCNKCDQIWVNRGGNYLYDGTTGIMFRQQAIAKFDRLYKGMTADEFANYLLDEDGIEVKIYRDGEWSDGAMSRKEIMAIARDNKCSLAVTERIKEGFPLCIDEGGGDGMIVAGSFLKGFDS